MLRRWLRPAIVAGAVGASVAAGLLVTHLSAQAACGVYWIGGNGNFNTASNWSTGVVPTSASDVCITQTTMTAPPASADTYTVQMNGTFTIRSLTLGGPSGTQTFVIPSGFELDLGVDSTVNTNGVLTLGDAGLGNSILCCYSVNLTNAGHLNTVAGGGGGRYWRTSVTNGPSGGIDVAGTTLQDGLGGGSTRTTNNGIFVVEATGSLAIGGGGNPQFFVNSGGSITNNGVVSTSSSTFTQRGGTESGNPIVLGNVTVLDDDLSAAAALFKLANGSQNLTGTGTSPGIASGQTLTVAGNDNAKLYVDLTNAGTITLGDAANAPSWLCCYDHSLTNTGHLNTVVGGGGNRYLWTNVTSAASGTIDIAGPTLQDGGGGGSTRTTNNGTFVVEATGSLAIGGGGNPQFFVNSGGSITNNGAFSTTSSTFTQRGGTESGTPIVLGNVTVLDDDLSAGAALFKLANGSQNLTGTGTLPGIAAGQTLTVAGNDNAQLYVDLTNAGTITLGDVTNAPSWLCCYGHALTNTGHLNTVVGGGGNRYLQANVTNAASGTIDIGGPTLQDGGGGGATPTTNNGTIILENGVTLALAGGSTFTQGSGGTFATTIDASATTFGQLTAGGGSVSVNGKLKVTTVGSPAAGSSWPIISSANRSGQFSSLDFGLLNYAVQYPATGVTLVAQAPCDYWIGGTGNFNTASNWSMGAVPNTTFDVCITQTTTSTPPATADTYTVLVDSNVGVGTLKLGGPNGAQTLQVAGSNSQFLINTTGTINSNGVLLLGDNNVANGWSWLAAGGNSSLLTNSGLIKTIQGSGGVRYLRLNITNAADGKVDLAASNTAQDTVAVTTNYGTVTVESGATYAISNSGTFTNAGGTATNNGTVALSSGGAFVNSAGSVTNNGSFSLSNSKFTQRGGTESGNPVVVAGGSTLDDDLSAGAALFSLSGTNAGPSILTGTGSSPGIAVGQVVTLPAAGTQTDVFAAMTNAGTINLGDAGSGVSYLCCGGPLTNTGHLNTVLGGGGGRWLALPVINAAGGILDIAAPTAQSGYSITNKGTLTVEASGSLTLITGDSFVNSGGRVTNIGSFSLNNSTFTQRGGSESGNPVVLTSSTLDDDLGAGPALFSLTGPNTSGVNTLTGTGPNPGVAGGQVVTLPSVGTQTDVNLSVTNAGTINLGDAGNGVVLLNPHGVTLTNTGQLNAVLGGGGDRYVRGNVINAVSGIVDIAAPTHVDANGTTFNNNGSVTVEASGSLALSSFSFINAAGGSVTNSGAFSVYGGTFTERGSEFGNPVLLQYGMLDDDLSAGPANFLLSNPNGLPYPITGTGTQPGVAAGQLITIPANNSSVDLNVSLTNAGTIVLGDNSGTGFSVVRGGLSSVVLTNNGHLNTLQGGGGNRYFRTNVTNAPGGMVDIGGPTLQDVNGTTFTNNGTLIVEPGSTYYLRAGATFTQGAGGTFQTTIDANATKFGQLTGGGDAVSLNGTLKLITVGRPALGSIWPIISNANRSGTFPGHDFGNWNYDVQYPSTGVTLVAQGTCDVWIGGDGNFGTAASWSLGFVPTSIDDACINATTATTPKSAADTYSVLVNGFFSVHSLTLGGPSATQTLVNPPAATLTLLASSSINAHGALIVNSGGTFKMADMTNAGTITLGDSGNADSFLGCSAGCSPTGPTLTNNGTLKTIQGGGGIRHVQVIVINAVGATLDIAGTAVQTDAGCNNPGGIGQNRAIINNGTVTIEAAANFSPDCGFVNSAGATVVNNGTLTPGGAFVQRGTESGNPVLFMNGSGIDDDLSAGPGAFVYSGSAGYPSGQNSLGGSGPNPGIPAGQVITIASTNTYIGIYPNIKNAGTIILGDNSGSGDSALCCSYFTALPTITNTGTIKTVQGSGGIRHLEVNVANSPGGIIDIAADTRQDQACGTGGVNATSISNGGTFTIEATGHYAMSNCPAGGYQNTFTQGVFGTFQTAVDANATKFGQLSGGTVNLDGQLKVTTVGSPAIGSSWPIISGANRSGVFATRDLDGSNYDVNYSTTGATLVARALARPYHPLPPKRILDTRQQVQIGPYSTPFGPNESRDVTVAGLGGVPATGASAVVLNVTVTDTTSPSYLTLYPTGVPRPLASNLNWVAGNTTPNLVEVALGTSGQVSVYNAYGSVDVIIDVAGYVSAPGVTNVPDGLFNPVVPMRVLDTRFGTGAAQAPVGANQTIEVQVTGVAGSNVPTAGVSGVVLNVTVTNPTAGSYLTVFPTGGGQPLASNLNFVAGQTVPNRVIVKVGTGGKVSFYNAFGTVDVIGDVGGWYTDATLGGNGSTFTGITPTRIYDTRASGLTPIGPDKIRGVPVAGMADIPAMNSLTPPTAVVLNVTVTNTTAGSYLTVWPTGAGRPLASDLNYVAGQTVPNLVVVQIGADGTISLYNAYGSTDVVIDVVGYYS